MSLTTNTVNPSLTDSAALSSDGYLFNKVSLILRFVLKKYAGRSKHKPNNAQKNSFKHTYGSSFSFLILLYKCNSFTAIIVDKCPFKIGKISVSVHYGNYRIRQQGFFCLDPKDSQV